MPNQWLRLSQSAPHKWNWSHGCPQHKSITELPHILRDFNLLTYEKNALADHIGAQHKISTQADIWTTLNVYSTTHWSPPASQEQNILKKRNRALASGDWLPQSPPRPNPADGTTMLLYPPAAAALNAERSLPSTCFEKSQPSNVLTTLPLPSIPTVHVFTRHFLTADLLYAVFKSPK